MNKTELVTKVMEESQLSRKDAVAAINATFNTITAELAKGERVVVLGFGTFETRSRAARTGRNPATGETIKIKASKAPAFKAGKALKAAVNVCVFKKYVKQRRSQFKSKFVAFCKYVVVFGRTLF